jgi:hypothetical protein
VKETENDGDRGPEKLFARRLDLTEKLHELTLQQRETIRSGDWERLKTILNEKDQRIHEFNQAENRLKRWNSRGGFDPCLPAYERFLSRTESKLKAIQSMEDECRRSLTEAKKQAEKTLRQIKSAHDGIKRFIPARHRISRFIDLRK